MTFLNSSVSQEAVLSLLVATVEYSGWCCCVLELIAKMTAL